MNLNRNTYHILNYMFIIAFIIYSLISISIFRVPLFDTDPSHVVINGDLEIPLTIENLISDYYPLWSDQYSKSNLLIMARYPIILPLLFIAKNLDMTPMKIIEIFWILTAILAGLSAYLTTFFILKKEFRHGKIFYIYIASLIAGFFYLFNPFFTLESRHMLIRFSYAILPLLFLAFTIALEKKEFKYIFMASLAWIFITANPRGLIFGGMILAISCIYITLYNSGLEKEKKEKDKNFNYVKKFTNILPTISSIIVIYLLLSSFWILPYMVVNQDSRIEPGYMISEESLSITSNIHNIKDIIYLKMPNIFTVARPDRPFAYNPEAGIIEKSENVRIFLSVFFILAIFSILLIRKSFHVLYFVFIYLTFVVIVGIKSIEPVWEFYIWVVLYSPISDNFGWMFRRTIDFYPFIMFSLSILIGLAIYSYMKIFDEIFRPKIANTLIILTLSIFIFIISIQSWPLFTGSFNGELKKVEIPNEYIDTNKWLENQKNDDKIIWIPKYETRNTTWINNRPVKWVQDFWSYKDTYFISRAGARRTDNDIFFEFISSIHNRWSTDILGQNRTNNLGKILSLLDIRYIGYHDDFPKRKFNREGYILSEPNTDTLEDMYKNINTTDIYTLSNINGTYIMPRTLSNLYGQNDMVLVYKEGFMHVFENKEPLSKFYIPSTITITDAEYDILTALSQFSDLDLKNAGIFFIEKSGFSGIPKNFDNILLTEDENIFIDINKSEVLLEPFKEVKTYSPENVWSRYKTSEPGSVVGMWKSYIEDIGIKNWEFDYGRGFIFTKNESDKNSVTMTFDISDDDTYELFIRPLYSQHGGAIKVTIDEKSYDLHTYGLYTLDQVQKFKWEKIDTINLTKGTHTLTLTNTKGFNAVNLISIFNARDRKIYMQNVMNNLNNKKLIYFFEAERDFKNKNAIVQSFGGGSSNGMGILLKGDSNISRNIDIIKEGNYKLSIRLKGTIDLNIDNRSYILKSNLSSNLSNDLSDNLELVDTDIIHLRKGNNYLTIMPLNDSFIDVVWLYSADKDQQHLSDIFNGSKESKHDINYSKIDPTKYRLSINSNKPFILAFTDSYNPSWIVRNNESEYNSLPIYSAINSFEINDTGNLDITIEYKPQEWFYYGSYISIFTVIISICYLILRKIKKLRKIKNDI